MERLLKVNSSIPFSIIAACLLSLYFYGPFSPEINFALFFIPFFMVHGWYFLVYNFLNKELQKSKTGLILVSFFIILSLITGGINLYVNVFAEQTALAQNFLEYTSMWDILDALTAAAFIPICVFMIIRVHQYLYARSLLFIVLEIIFPMIGMLTLSNTLIEEKEERLKYKMHPEELIEI